MKPLKALLVEDSNDDAALLLRHLSNEGYDVQSEIVQTSADLKAALAERDWDIILSDYTMPHFTGLDALRVLKKSNQDIPLIIISGTIGEDIAVEAMLDGANDYLMKGNLTRLAPAIERDLENAARRRKQKQAEDALRRSEELLANAQRIAHIGSWETDLVNNHLYWSDEVYRIFGVSKNEFGATLESFVNFIHPEDRQSVQAAADAAISGNAPYNIEHRIVRSDGEERIVCEIGEVTFDESGKPLRFTGTVQDVTGRKLIEAALENAAKRERAMIENALDVICTIDAEGKFASVSPASLGVWGYQPEELVGHPYIELVAPEDVAKTNQAAAEIMSGVAARDFENRYRHKNGSMVDIRWTAFWSDTEQMMFCVAHDITERKRAEEEKMLLAAQLEQQHERLNNIIDNVAGVVWEAYGKPDE
ncbi:MAG TPA: PAS domain-containing protein, partial [Pyrinomonadaceae bacterium]|nr:PAS domain-containing protein [Pyrinomonadaceae bacterium]